MVRFCQEDDAQEYLIGTELGMLHRLSKDCPGKSFYPITEVSVCRNMKLTTLDKLLEALRDAAPEITVGGSSKVDLPLRVVEKPGKGSFSVRAPQACSPVSAVDLASISSQVA